MIKKYVDYYAVCDLCNFQDPGSLAQPSKEKAITIAKDNGWKISKKTCLCPTCVVLPAVVEKDNNETKTQ